MPAHFAQPVLSEPNRYWSEDAFLNELNAVESRLWNMVGLTTDIPAKNDFLTVMVGRKSVIVQNFDVGIRAFDNVCGHRGCRIRSQVKGTGAIRCPYHSWSFGADGAPLVIPQNDEAFGIAPEERQNYALNAWQVALCGRLIFVRKATSGPSLKDSLGELCPVLERLSLAFGQEIAADVWDYEANWKVCVENTLDEYHANFVHPTTFRPLLGKDFQYEYLGNHSTVIVRAQEQHLAKWNRLGRLFANRPITDDNYSHYLIFPLTTLASTFGATYSVQTFTPVTPERTRLNSRLFLSEGIAASGISAALGASAQMFNKQVFEEDKFVCEQMQLGLRQAEGKGVAGRFEQRLIHFQKALNDVFGAELA